MQIYKNFSWKYLSEGLFCCFFSRAQNAYFLVSILNSLKGVLKFSDWVAPDLILVELILKTECTCAKSNLGNRVLGEVENARFMAFPGKGGHSSSCPSKFCVPRNCERINICCFKSLNGSNRQLIQYSQNPIVTIKRKQLLCVPTSVQFFFPHQVDFIELSLLMYAVGVRFNVCTVGHVSAWDPQRFLKSNCDLKSLVQLEWQGSPWSLWPPLLRPDSALHSPWNTGYRALNPWFSYFLEVEDFWEAFLAMFSWMCLFTITVPWPPWHFFWISVDRRSSSFCPVYLELTVP